MPRIANYRRCDGVWDGIEITDMPEHAASYARQVDFGKIGSIRNSPGMLRHVTHATGAASIFLNGTNDRIHNIIGFQNSEGEDKLVCIKNRASDNSAAIWDITDGGSISLIMNATGPNSANVAWKSQWPHVVWGDEIFMVNGQTEITIKRSSESWTDSTIGVAYNTATIAPTGASTTSGPLEAGTTYGFRILGYDTTKGAYGDLATVSGADMEVWVTQGASQEGITLTVGANNDATNLGVDQLRIFRTLAGHADFFHEGTITGSTATFTIAKTDEELAQQALYEPGGPPTGTLYLIARHNTRLIGINTTDVDRLYFSADGPHEWHVTNYRKLPTLGQPIGLSSTGQVVHIHYDSGFMATITGYDVKDGVVATDCKETFAARGQGSIVDSTFKSYYAGRSGLYEFTGQACPRKISHAVNGTWKGLTKADIKQAQAVVFPRDDGDEYWCVFPTDNLMIRCPLEGRRLGTFFSVDRCHATAIGRALSADTVKIYLGTNEGAVFVIDEDNAQWGTTAQLKTVVLTGGAADSISLTGAETANFGHLGMPIAITSGGGFGQVVWATSYSASDNITVTPSLSPVPVSGDRVLIGAMPFDLRTKYYDMRRPMLWKNWLSCMVSVEQVTNTSNRDAMLSVYALFLDYIPSDTESGQLPWELIGMINTQFPDAFWLSLGSRCSVYLQLRFTAVDYAIKRRMAGWSISYDILQRGPQ